MMWGEIHSDIKQLGRSHCPYPDSKVLLLRSVSSVSCYIYLQ
uniref:Uncharacterized protein n=1 Tax=Anguilla anguilla TaxID=7936 RepID=A0A0E9V0P5_ANGAN